MASIATTVAMMTPRSVTSSIGNGRRGRLTGSGRSRPAPFNGYGNERMGRLARDAMHACAGVMRGDGREDVRSRVGDFTGIGARPTARRALVREIREPVGRRS